MIDAVYPLGSGSKIGNEEIRYSIRSLLATAENLGKIYVVGIDPGFLKWDDRLIHIPYIETHRAYRNVWEKLQIVAKDKRISEKFVWMNDDFYLLKRFDAANIPNLIRGGDLSRVVSGGKKLGVAKMAEVTKAYHRVLKHTLTCLRARNLTVFQFSTHQPVNLEKAKVQMVYDEFQKDLRLPYGLSFRCCYGNLHRLPHKTLPTRIIRDTFNPPRGPLAFASHQHVDKEMLIRGLSGMFPEPSLFEAQGI